MICAIIFPIYLLGSMTLDIFNQTSKHDGFVEDFKAYTDQDLAMRAQRAKDYNKNLNGNNESVDPFQAEDYKAKYKISDDPDAVFGYISIPSIDVTQPIYLGASFDHLLFGFAHVDGTALPIGEKGTRSVIAGHRGGYYGRLDLYNAHNIKKGDILKIDLGTDVLKYKMVDREIIDPSDWEKLKPFNDKDMLTLITCDPFPAYYNRMLINFERVYDKKAESKEVLAPLDEKSADYDLIAKDRAQFTKTDQGSPINTKYILIGATGFLILLLVFLVFRLVRITGQKQ